MADNPYPVGSLAYKSFEATQAQALAGGYGAASLNYAVAYGATPAQISKSFGGGGGVVNVNEGCVPVTGYDPFNPAPWPPKDPCAIANLGYPCLPEDWPANDGSYYSSTPLCPDGRPMQRCPNGCAGTFGTQAFGLPTGVGGIFTGEGATVRPKTELEARIYPQVGGSPVGQQVALLGISPVDLALSGKQPTVGPTAPGTVGTIPVQTPFSGGTMVVGLGSQIGASGPSAGGPGPSGSSGSRAPMNGDKPKDNTMLYLGLAAIVAVVIFAARS